MDFKPQAEEPNKDYPVVLITGRVLFHFHTGTMSRKCLTLNNQLDEGYIEINPTDAKRLGISEGEKVKVNTRRGEIVTKAFLTPVVSEGTVFIPFHFAESPANVLTNSVLDPKSKIPELKICAAGIKRHEPNYIR